MLITLLALTAPWQILLWPSPDPPTVDGRLDEPLWQNIPVFEDFHQVLPKPGPAPFRTSIRITRDAEALYIGAVLEDPPTGERQSNLSRRDRMSSTDDSLSITLDPLGTRVFGQDFTVNPDCSISDGIYKESTLSTDGSADFAFQAACQQTEHGWSVEFRIPFRELRYAEDSQLPWNILVQRSVVRDQVRTVANAPLPRDPLCLLCLAPSIEGMGPLPDPSFVKFTPYTLYRHNEKDHFQTGLDVKYRMNAESIVDVTVNPDFSQVNLDEPQLSANTQFAVSYPENRPFFLEGADLLDSPLKTIATRSIKQPSWGMKYTHRSQSNDTMVLTGDDSTINRVLVPGAYGSRFRPIDAVQKFAIISSHWKGEGYNLGLNMSTRSYEDQGSNQTIGLDGLHYLSGVDSLRWQSQLSATSNRWDTESASFYKGAQQNGSAQFLQFQHKGETWFSAIDLKSFTDDFRTDVGFNPRNAYQLGILTNAYSQNLDDTYLEFYLQQAQKQDLQGRTMQTQNVPGFSVRGFHGLDFGLETRPNTLERIRADSRLHRYQQHFVSIAAYPGQVITYVQCDLTWGERLDVAGDRVVPGRANGCTLRLALTKKVELNTTASEEVLPDILVNRALSHLLVIPMTARWSLRYIRQQEIVDRKGSERFITQTDSWNLAHENHEGWTVYAGTTTERESAEATQTQREYYLKLALSLP